MIIIINKKINENKVAVLQLFEKKWKLKLIKTLSQTKQA